MNNSNDQKTTTNFILPKEPFNFSKGSFQSKSLFGSDKPKTFKIKEPENENLQKQLNDQLQIIEDLKKQIIERDSIIHELESKHKEPMLSIFKSPRENKELIINTQDEISKFEKVKIESKSNDINIYEVVKKESFTMKEIKNINQEQIAQIVQINKVLNNKKHPNIVQTDEIFIDEQKSSITIVTERFTQNLDEVIKTNKLNKVDASFAIYQIAEGMKYIHYNKIIHSGLKPSNIFISPNGQIKINDIGHSFLTTKQNQPFLLNDDIGSLYFMAPEIIKNTEKSEKIDVYSFGSIVYFILIGGKISQLTLQDLIGNKKIPSSFTQNAKEIIEYCCNENPQIRPNFDEIVEYLNRENCFVMELSKQEQEQYKNLIKEHQILIQSCLV